MQLGISGKARYRTIDEARIIDLLLVEGWAFDVRVGARAAAEQSARAVLDRIVGMGLPYQQSESGVRRFDPAEVYNFLVWVGRERREETWRERCIDTARRLVWEPHLGAHLGARSGACAGGEQRVAPSPNLLGPQRFSVTLRRTFNSRIDVLEIACGCACPCRWRTPRWQICSPATLLLPIWPCRQRLVLRGWMPWWRFQPAARWRWGSTPHSPPVRS